jgi:hypothetical protein
MSITCKKIEKELDFLTSRYYIYTERVIGLHGF